MTNHEHQEPLSPAEQASVLRDLRRLRDRPPPSDPSSGGCIVAILALIGLVFMPVIARVSPLGSMALFALGIGLGLVAVVGALLGLFGGGFVRGAIGEQVEEAIGVLIAEYPDGDPARMREAAIRILDGSLVSTGPTTVGTFDTEEVTTRLGPALPYVMRIERFLVAREEVYPCFLDSGTVFDGPEDPAE